MTPGATAARLLFDCLRAGGTIFACGNGGSAEQANHFVAELVGTFEIKDRDPFRAVSLSSNMALVTAIANDQGFEWVFQHQLKGLARPGDVLVALTTSGQSDNVINAVRMACAYGARTIALTGPAGIDADATWCSVTVETRHACRRRPWRRCTACAASLNKQ